MKSCSPYFPDSLVPLPLCLYPPKAVDLSGLKAELMLTVPLSILVATRSAREIFSVYIAAIPLCQLLPVNHK